MIPKELTDHFLTLAPIPAQAQLISLKSDLVCTALGIFFNLFSPKDRS